MGKASRLALFVVILSKAAALAWPSIEGKVFRHLHSLSSKSRVPRKLLHALPDATSSSEEPTSLGLSPQALEVRGNWGSTALLGMSYIGNLQTHHIIDGSVSVFCYLTSVCPFFDFLPPPRH